MPNEKNANELLKWGLRNSASAAPGSKTTEEIAADIQAGKRPDLADPKLYEAIMGKSEAVMMKEELAVAMDESRSHEDRCVALDNFEMLIESIDNANNMENMKMWPPVLSLLSSSSSKIQLASAWIVGTAVQNNDKAQVAILKYQPLAPLLSLLESSDMDVRSKAMYALSGLLKHNPEAVVQFQDMDGWNKLKLALLDPNIILRRKTVFLINSLLFQDPAGQQESSSDETSPAASASVPPPNSTATAVAPAPQSSSPLTAAPLERGPETLLSGVEHPDVAKALISSELLKIILISLLPSSTDGGNGVESIREKGLMLNYGPDGDQEPRRDLDYSEKAARCLLTFTEKLNPSTTLVDEETLRLLNLFAEQLRSEPIEEVEDREGTRSTRATELSIEQESLDNLERKLREIKVTGDRL